MPLPDPAPREKQHLRSYTLEAFRRADGMWEIDGTIRDSKPFAYHDHVRGRMPPGSAIHDMSVRVTFDGDFTVHAVVCAFDDTPYPFCLGGGDNAHLLVGANLMKGWRGRLNEVLGMTNGCTHLKEMLANLPTVAFQTLSTYWEDRQRPESLNTQELSTQPRYVGSCHAMALDSPVVAAYFPQFGRAGD
jgi:hypothetical protein